MMQPICAESAAKHQPTNQHLLSVVSVSSCDFCFSGLILCTFPCLCVLHSQFIRA